VSNCEQTVITLPRPYVDLQSLNVSQSRTGSWILRMLPSMGRASGPGGSGGCERLSQYFRYQVKPTSAKADVAMYNPGPASSIVRTVLQFQVAEEMNYCIYILYVT